MPFTQDSNSSFNHQMGYDVADDPKATSFISSKQSEDIQKRIAQILRGNVETHHEVIQAFEKYQLAIEALCQATDKVSQVVGKMTLSCVESRELRKEIQKFEPDHDRKYRNLELALNQITRFHDVVGEHQAIIAGNLLNEFDRPVQSQINGFKDYVDNWNKFMDRDMKKLQHEVKRKESQATKAGRKNSHAELSASLMELSTKVAEIGKLKVERFEDALNKDFQNQTLIAQHIQKILKTQIYSYRSIYHEGTPSKKQQEQPQKAPVKHPKDQEKQLSQNQDNVPVMNSNLHELSSPPKRSDSMRKSVQNPPKSQSSAQESAKEQMWKPHPPVPSAANRKTRYLSRFVTKNDSEDTVRKALSPNYPLDYMEMKENSSKDSVIMRQNSRSDTIRLREEIFTRYYGRNSLDIPHDAFNDTELPLDEDLAYALYEFQGSEEDDLKIFEGDVVRIIEKDGEWVYCMKLVPSEFDEQEFIPALTEDGLDIKMGWVPNNFLEMFD